ncbi:MAG: ECF-type sigma factor [Acidobacteriota bacterium]
MSEPQDRQEPKGPEITRVLRAAASGDAEASDRLWELVERELRSLAGRLMKSEKAGHTLQATAVVHEAFLQLQGDLPELNDRRHFLAIAARVMRRVLVEHARRRDAAKRGGDWERVSLAGVGEGAETVGDERILALHEALEKLAELSEIRAAVVEEHWFGGMTFDEIAAHHGLSTRQARQHWLEARAWLQSRMK